MPEITVSGTLAEVYDALTRIKALTGYHKNYGWSLYQSDEGWEYRTREDEHVCPKCEEFGKTRTFDGTQIPAEFPDRRRLSGEDGGLFHPEVHVTYPQFRGHCRCRVEFQNISETLVNRLDAELRTVL